jgi:hypothetical protein
MIVSNGNYGRFMVFNNQGLLLGSFSTLSEVYEFVASLREDMDK